MNFAAASIYWVIVALWVTVLVTVLVAYVKNPRAFGTTRLLLCVLAIDTFRNIFENVYFGLYFGGLYGLFPHDVLTVLGQPLLLIVPKILNVVGGVLSSACCSCAGFPWPSTRENWPLNTLATSKT